MEYRQTPYASIWYKPSPDIFAIFLDMDGVMCHNRQNRYVGEDIHFRLAELYGKKDSYSDNEYVYAKVSVLRKSNVANLMELIAYIESKGLKPVVVFITAWRQDATTEEFIQAFSETEFSGYIAGKTAHHRDPEHKSGAVCVGNEYKTSYGDLCKSKSADHWLETHGLHKSDGYYIIIDDDEAAGTGHTSNYCQPSYSVGFNSHSLEEAKKIVDNLLPEIKIIKKFRDDMPLDLPVDFPPLENLHLELMEIKNKVKPIKDIG